MKAHYCVQFFVNGKNKTIIRSTTNKEYAENVHSRASWLIKQAKKNEYADRISDYLDENIDLNEIRANIVWFHAGDNFLAWLYINESAEFHCLAKFLLEFGYKEASKNPVIFKALLRAERAYGKTSKDKCFVYPVDDVVMNGTEFQFNIPVRVTTPYRGSGEPNKVDPDYPDAWWSNNEVFISVDGVRITDEELFKYFSKKPSKVRGVK